MVFSATAEHLINRIEDLLPWNIDVALQIEPSQAAWTHLKNIYLRICRRLKSQHPSSQGAEGVERSHSFGLIASLIAEIFY
jgi:hypothetical protein